MSNAAERAHEVVPDYEHACVDKGWGCRLEAS
jgi:hypothetical protein